MNDQAHKILVVEDSSDYQALLAAILKDYQVELVDSGEKALELAPLFQPDLVVLDINLPGIDGFATCKGLRANAMTREVPVLFESVCQSLEDRLTAYGAGGNDYISKPFSRDEMLAKVAVMLEHKRQRDALKSEVLNSYEALQEVQLMSGRLQSVYRFVEASVYCADYDMLFNIFFKTARDIESSCVLRIIGQAGDEMRSSTGTINQLEREILEMAPQRVQRIRQFGHDRAVFNWAGRAILLVRNVGLNIDMAAILMNAVDAAVKAMDTENNLMQKVKTIDAQNQLIRDQVQDEFDAMGGEISSLFMSLGLTTALGPDEEDRLTDFVQSYFNRTSGRLAQLSSNNAAIIELIHQLRSPPPELQDFLYSVAAPEQDSSMGICFF